MKFIDVFNLVVWFFVGLGVMAEGFWEAKNKKDTDSLNKIISVFIYFVVGILIISLDLWVFIDNFKC